MEKSNSGDKCTTNVEQNISFLQRDIRYFQSLINKNVKIETIDGKIHVSRVYVVDPVSKSVVTVRNGDEITNINIFPGHAIKLLESIEVIQGSASPETYNKINIPVIEENLNEKKMAVKAWLIKNLVDVNEDGMSLKVGDDLVIESPYDNEHCYSSNTIILQRIRTILKYMPA